jgi:hypothetical protein
VKWRETRIGGREDKALRWVGSGFSEEERRIREEGGIFSMFFWTNSGNNFIRG